VSYLVIALPADPRAKLITKGPFSSHSIAQRKLAQLIGASEAWIGQVVPTTKARSAPN
jgi:hypothetical protein